MCSHTPTHRNNWQKQNCVKYMHMYHTHSETSTLDHNLHYMHVSSYAWVSGRKEEVTHWKNLFFFKKKGKNQMKERLKIEVKTRISQGWGWGERPRQNGNLEAEWSIIYWLLYFKTWAVWALVNHMVTTKWHRELYVIQHTFILVWNYSDDIYVSSVCGLITS